MLGIYVHLKKLKKVFKKHSTNFGKNSVFKIFNKNFKEFSYIQTSKIFNFFVNIFNTNEIFFIIFKITISYHTTKYRKTH